MWTKGAPWPKIKERVRKASLLGASREPVWRHVFKFVVNEYKIQGKKFDEVWYLMPCAPLINSSDLVLASNYFKRKKTSAMLAVTEYSSPIQRAFKILIFIEKR